MEYHDQPLQFISSHYFQLRNKDDMKYVAIKGILEVITYLPLVMIPLISCLTIIYIYPVISSWVDKYSKMNKKIPQTWVGKCPKLGTSTKSGKNTFVYIIFDQLYCYDTTDYTPFSVYC